MENLKRNMEPQKQYLWPNHVCRTHHLSKFHVKVRTSTSNSLTANQARTDMVGNKGGTRKKFANKAVGWGQAIVQPVFNSQPVDDCLRMFSWALSGRRSSSANWESSKESWKASRNDHTMDQETTDEKTAYYMMRYAYI